MNWVYAAAALTFENPTPNGPYGNEDGAVDGTQEDVDLIVAFEDSSGIVHLVMLEAKGVASFTNAQFEHKISRFKQIFGDAGKKWPKIRPHFGLLSPKEPQRLNYHPCPAWLKVEGRIPWFQMWISEDRLVVFRCDSERRRSKKGKFWAVSGICSGQRRWGLCRLFVRRFRALMISNIPMVSSQQYASRSCRIFWCSSRLISPNMTLLNSSLACPPF